MLHWSQSIPTENSETYYLHIATFYDTNIAKVNTV